MTLLMKKDILTEEESKFYIAECVIDLNKLMALMAFNRFWPWTPCIK